jgi:hypothetical protein
METNKSAITGQLRGEFYAAAKAGKTSMTTYTVQFVLPVDKPENKVLVVKRKSHWLFEIPINHPDAHNLGFMDLLAASELSGLLGLSPSSNTAFTLIKPVPPAVGVVNNLSGGKGKPLLTEVIKSRK